MFCLLLERNLSRKSPSVVIGLYTESSRDFSQWFPAPELIMTSQLWELAGSLIQQQQQQYMTIVLIVELIICSTRKRGVPTLGEFISTTTTTI